MKNKNIQQVVTMFMAVLMFNLLILQPVVANGQVRQSVQKQSRVAEFGSREYYQDDAVVKTLKRVPGERNFFDLTTGGDPQVPSSQKSKIPAAASDEMDLSYTDAMKQVFHGIVPRIMTASYHEKLFIGDLPQFDKYGKELILRFRIMSNGDRQLVLILNCGNWSRLWITTISCQFYETPEISSVDSTNGDTISTVITTNYGCGFITKATNSHTTTNICPTCIPEQQWIHVGTWGPYEKGQSVVMQKAFIDTVEPNIKGKQSFAALTALGQAGQQYVNEWNRRGYGDVQLKFLQVMQDACPNALGLYKVVITGLGVEGDKVITPGPAKHKSHRWILWVALAAIGAIIIAVVLQRTEDVLPIKSNPIPPNNGGLRPSGLGDSGLVVLRPIN